ncbi:hypothetical protein EDEG_00142 [Edhazardia aedis USNM 41457]|uniref:Uncharacterized protein n=1 Tax=Edhazardia aedis (strain USNM 41457) TaxID=1003232 RepID=J9DSQ7_EDHAE|nr:hypothetical protein EDEG_00142 [Edhazardia aedis USNM 41457]|eukprot:EJW04357.1 hypothetical protein EDEG_00142 [Edhazardia aedis USNM 41457]
MEEFSVHQKVQSWINNIPPNDFTPHQNSQNHNSCNIYEKNTVFSQRFHLHNNENANDGDETAKQNPQIPCNFSEKSISPFNLENDDDFDSFERKMEICNYYIDKYIICSDIIDTDKYSEINYRKANQKLEEAVNLLNLYYKNPQHIELLRKKTFFCVKDDLLGFANGDEKNKMLEFILNHKKTLKSEQVT